jgi:hypothetical protein
MLSANALGELFPISKPMTGHTVPGVGQRYPMTTVTYPDRSSDPALRKRPVENPVKNIMGMHDELSGKHPALQKIMSMLKGKSGGPQLGEGYQRVREDLGWRGVTRKVDKYGVPVKKKYGDDYKGNIADIHRLLVGQPPDAPQIGIV